MHLRPLVGVFVLFTVSAFLINTKRPLASSNLFMFTGKAQGTSYAIKYSNPSALVSQKDIDSLFNLFDQSLSIYNPSSLISAINTRRKTAKLDSHLLKIITFSDSLSKVSNNTFNIKLLPLLEVWGFKNHKIKHYPDSNHIKQVLEFIINKNIKINDLNIIKSSRKIRLDIDGVAQGYCVDQISSFLISKGINNFIVEIGGEVFAKGADQLGRKWSVGIQGGDYLMGNKGNEDLVIRLNDQGITTSGKLQKYRKIGDSTISHVLDPRTGYPVKNDVVSVTVLAKNAMLADALDNAFMVMGIAETMKWLEKNPNIGVFMVYRKKDGSLADTANSFFKNQMSYLE